MAAVSIVNNANPASVLERAQEILQTQAGSLVQKQRENRSRTVAPSQDSEKLRMREKREEKKRPKDQGVLSPAETEEEKEPAASPQATPKRGIHLTV